MTWFYTTKLWDQEQHCNWLERFFFLRSTSRLINRRCHNLHQVSRFAKDRFWARLCVGLLFMSLVSNKIRVAISPEGSMWQSSWTTQNWKMYSAQTRIPFVFCFCFLRQTNNLTLVLYDKPFTLCLPWLVLVWKKKRWSACWTNIKALILIHVCQVEVKFFSLQTHLFLGM